jgi:hypothetical protein
MGIVETDIVPQSVKQRHVGVGVDRMGRAVDVERNALIHGGQPSLNWVGGLRPAVPIADHRGESLADACRGKLVPKTQLGNGHEHKIDVLNPTPSMNSGTTWTTADVRFAECPRWVQSRSWHDVRVTSALHPIATKSRTLREVWDGPVPDQLHGSKSLDLMLESTSFDAH